MGKPQDSRTLTASAHTSPSARLGHFDIAALRTFRNLAERHASEALGRAITSAADPSDFIQERYIEEFIDQAAVVWIEGLSIIKGVFGDLPIPFYESVINEAIVDSASYYRELLKGIINKKAFGMKEPIYGEFLKGALVQYGDVRPLLVRLGGGSPVSTVPLMGGITSGNTMTDWLRSNGIDTDKKIWLYGYEDEPRRTFNSHLSIDGLVFESWEDEGLEISPQDAWLRISHMFPGDHRGCACVVAPFVPNFGEDYILDV